MDSDERAYKQHGTNGRVATLLLAAIYCWIPIVLLIVGTAQLRDATEGTAFAPVTRALALAVLVSLGAVFVASFATSLTNGWRRRRGQPTASLGFGFFTTTFRHRWLELDAESANVEWANMHRWPRGGALQRARRCELCGLIEIDVNDADGRWCVLFGHMPTRMWLTWLAGLFVSNVGTHTRRTRLTMMRWCFWRIEGRWIRSDVPHPDLPGVTLTWRAPPSGRERIHALDTAGRDIFLYRNTEYVVDSFTLIGPFLMWNEEPLVATALSTASENVHQ
jgi:hypothetical protein